MSNIIELARESGAMVYTNRHYPDRPYRTFSPEALEKFYTLARADYETKLSAVMPADFKDWHENNRNEWPEVAAWVITNPREQRAELEADNAKLKQMYELLASAWFYGNWKAETHNERLMQKLMEDAGYWPTSEDEIVARAALGETK